MVGLATLLSGLVLSSQATITLLVTGVLVIALVSVALSYMAWRNDPDRSPLSGEN